MLELYSLISDVPFNQLASINRETIYTSRHGNEVTVSAKTFARWDQ